MTHTCSPNARMESCLASEGPDLEGLRRTHPTKEASLTLRNTQHVQTCSSLLSVLWKQSVVIWCNCSVFL